MSQNQLHNIDKLEADLWEAADQLRANSKLTSTEYCMPVLGVIFLRHAANRFDAATKQIQEDQASGKMPKRAIVHADYLRRRALWLPEVARYDAIMALPKNTDLGKALVEAMNAIETEFEPLKGQLPKDFTIFERTVLEDLLRIFNRDSLRAAGGDVFGRIYEYFLMKFAMEGAQDNGEFFTPPRWCRPSSTSSSRSTAPCSTRPAAPAGCLCSPAHFIEHRHDTAKRVTILRSGEKPPPPSGSPR